MWMAIIDSSFAGDSETSDLVIGAMQTMTELSARQIGFQNLLEAVGSDSPEPNGIE
jgi:hypothetical protein